MNAQATPNFDSKTKTGIQLSFSNINVKRIPPIAATRNEAMKALLMPTSFTMDPLTMLAIISEAHEAEVLTKMLPGIYFM